MIGRTPEKRRFIWMRGEQEDNDGWSSLSLMDNKNWNVEEKRNERRARCENICNLIRVRENQ